ncbi:MAG: hypothetical protein ACI8X3_002858, partial [Saprospiraceae bacterium]
AHKVWMMRSYALTLSAVSLRIYQLILGHFFYMDPVVQYLLVSWVSWLGNLMILEWKIRRDSQKVKNRVTSFLSFSGLK